MVTDKKSIDLTGGAFQIEETYIGPPKEFILGKLLESIKSQLSLIQHIEELIPENLDFPEGWESVVENGLQIKRDYLKLDALSSLRNMVKSYYALNNKLGLFDNNIFSNSSVDEILDWFKSSGNFPTSPD
ncbi:hypothetical protein KKF91_12540 [Myxococcota bacterium]|nr:hypothetical protein [Myxococcota bacterium]